MNAYKATRKSNCISCESCKRTQYQWYWSWILLEYNLANNISTISNRSFATDLTTVLRCCLLCILLLLLLLALLIRIMYRQLVVRNREQSLVGKKGAGKEVHNDRQWVEKSDATKRDILKMYLREFWWLAERKIEQPRCRKTNCKNLLIVFLHAYISFCVVVHTRKCPINELCEHDHGL